MCTSIKKYQVFKDKSCNTVRLIIENYKILLIEIEDLNMERYTLFESQKTKYCYHIVTMTNSMSNTNLPTLIPRVSIILIKISAWVAQSKANAQLTEPPGTPVVLTLISAQFLSVLASGSLFSLASGPF